MTASELDILFQLAALGALAIICLALFLYCPEVVKRLEDWKHEW